MGHDEVVLTACDKSSVVFKPGYLDYWSHVAPEVEFWWIPSCIKLIHKH